MINGKAIKNQRKKLHISQKELAKNITTQGTISALERNSTTPSSEILAKILERLSLSLDDVLVANVKTGNQNILNTADRQFMSYHFEDALATLKKIKKIADLDQQMHFTFLKTTATMWVKENYDDAIFGYNKILQKSTDNSNIHSILAICELGVTYDVKGEPDKSAFYFEQLPTLLKKIDTDKNIFWYLMLLDNLSKYYSNIKKYRECLAVLNKAIAFAQKHNTPLFIDSFYFLYATTLREQQGAWNKGALSYLLKAWSFADFLEDKLVLSKAQEHLEKQGIL